MKEILQRLHATTKRGLTALACHGEGGLIALACHSKGGLTAPACHDEGGLTAPACHDKTWSYSPRMPRRSWSYSTCMPQQRWSYSTGMPRRRWSYSTCMQLGLNVNKFHTGSQHRHHEMCLVAKCNLHAKACHSCAVNTAWLECEQISQSTPA
jgi:hypothetical protein